MNPATKTPRIADEPIGRFEVANCIVPRRFTALIENFLRDNRTGNIQINIKNGEIRGLHVTEIINFGPNRPRTVGRGTALARP